MGRLRKPAEKIQKNPPHLLRGPQNVKTQRLSGITSTRSVLGSVLAREALKTLGCPQRLLSRSRDRSGKKPGILTIDSPYLLRGLKKRKCTEKSWYQYVFFPNRRIRHREERKLRQV